MERIIEIPEGYEARIEGNKVVIEPKESEDERIRKWIKKELESKYVVDNIVNNTMADKAFAYLEKQKEPLTPEEKMNHPLYLEGFDVGRSVGEVVSKPAEWSEEDKRALNDAIVAISMYANGQIPYILPSILLEDVERLKSLPPYWKPSEEQMEWLESAVKLSTDKPGIHGIILSLYEQLKRL